MAYRTGLAASLAETANASRDEFAEELNYAVARGFREGAQFALVALMIIGWGSWSA